MIRRLRRARRRSLIAGTAAFAMLSGGGMAGASVLGVAINPFGTTQVGTEGGVGTLVPGTPPNDDRVMLPDNQSVKPYSERIATISGYSVGNAISPDGTKLAVQSSGTPYGSVSGSVSILDPSTGAALQTFGGPGSAAPVYSPDGKALYTSTAFSTFTGAGTNTILKYTVGPDGLVTDPSAPQILSLPSPTFGMTLSADGKTLYAALSSANELAVIDTATMQVTATVPVGNAPDSVAIVGNQAFVSNRGGRPAGAGDTTNNTQNAPSPATPIVSSPVTGASTTGTVSVVDLQANAVTDTINVGLQPTRMTVEGSSLFVTNTNSDTVSIIDTLSHRVTQTFNVEPLPGSTVGSSPNSIAFADPHHLLVGIGGDNAIGVFGYNGPRTPVQYEGLIPTDWYPNQVQYDAKLGKVIVSNEGVGTDENTYVHNSLGSVTSFHMPDNGTLGTLTGQVFGNNGWNNLGSNENGQGQNGNGGPLPAIPTQLGRPSAIKHVFLIVKENWAYDPVLGNIGKGNSDPSLASSATYTPNEHSLADKFTLFDNFYDPGTSTDNGQSYIWQADNNDYLHQEEAAGFWPRSQPDFGRDALAYQRSGFIWNTVEAAGKTVKDYGAFESVGAPGTGAPGTWQQYYADSQILEGKAEGPLPVPIDQFRVTSDIPSLAQISNPDFPNYNLGIPDQYRVDVWNQDFQQQLKTNSVPNLTLMELPDDHTGGAPVTVGAQEADNDLALARIISDISHSSVWKNSAIFVMEDDTQNGRDHVDGHRAPLWIASPYATRGVINSSYYTQINVVKTIEQILGAQPLNQMDRAAVPMFDAFTNKPNFTPYSVLPNQVPLTQGATGLIPLTPTSTTESADPTAAADLAATSGPPAPTVPAAEKAVAAEWANWDKTEAVPKLTGPNAEADSVNPAQLNRYKWYSLSDWSKPYPGDKSILAPDQVPGRNLPSDFLGD